MSNNIDKIFYINLDHRQDRKIEIETELNKYELTYERFPAIQHKIGGVGCGRSHVEIFKNAKNAGYKNIIIFEDDFTFLVSKEIFEENLNKLFENDIKFDVCFLSYNLIESENVPDYPFLKKVIASQTSSGYIIHYTMFDTLIQLFTDAMNEFEKRDEHWLYSLDQIWKTIQPFGKWYCFTERIGKQRDSYSDISNVFSTNNC